MEQLDKNIYSVRELNRILRAQEGIVVYGIGDYGKQLVDFLFFINEKQKIKGIIVTEKGMEQEYRGIKIQTAANFLDKNKECLVIIAVSSTYQEDIIQVVQQYGRQYCCITEKVYWEIRNRMKDVRPLSPTNIDFLCPGFAKCGTTSFYRALQTIDSIYLPSQKENHFWFWYDKVENPEELLIEKYFDNIRQGQKVGMIDPTYAVEAERTYKFFGNKMKIIFLVRNPVEAVFSRFKMVIRNGRLDLDMAYQKNGGYFSIEIFDEFFESGNAGYKFIDMIKQYEKYYTRDQLKVVFFEELIHRPQTVINDVLDFICIQERYNCEQFPVANKVGFVMADLEGYRLARERNVSNVANRNMNVRDPRSEINNRSRLELEQRYVQASRIYGVKMTKEQRRKAQMYYDSSVRELEVWLNKDLTQLWF